MTTGPPSAAQPCVLLTHGEIFLRGRNRSAFVRRLHTNLRAALDGADGAVWLRNARNITVVGGDVPLDELTRRCRRVFGFRTVQPAVRVPSSPEAIRAAAVEALSGLRAGRPTFRFAVRVRRRDKTFPHTSSRLAADIGARVQEALGLPVDLTAPDVELRIVVDPEESYLSWRRHPGAGGLPVGCSGRALVLLSGGHDSPVAAHRAMRRGLRCDFVHFTGAPYTDPASAYKAYALARELNRYQPPGVLHLVALGAAQKELALVGAGRHQVVAHRRLMVRTAGALAHRTGAEALVTGDNLGQVASQTLRNLATVDEAAPLPLLRPLLGWEKQEIIDAGRALGTEAVSVLPDEDCCTLLAPPEVATRSRARDLERIERRLEMEDVVDALLSEARTLRPGDGSEDGPGDGSGHGPGTEKH